MYSIDRILTTERVVPCVSYDRFVNLSILRVCVSTFGALIFELCFNYSVRIHYLRKEGPSVSVALTCSWETVNLIAKV